MKILTRAERNALKKKAESIEEIKEDNNEDNNEYNNGFDFEFDFEDFDTNEKDLDAIENSDDLNNDLDNEKILKEKKFDSEEDLEEEDLEEEDLEEEDLEEEDLEEEDLEEEDLEEEDLEEEDLEEEDLEEEKFDSEEDLEEEDLEEEIVISSFLDNLEKKAAAIEEEKIDKNKERAELNKSIGTRKKLEEGKRWQKEAFENVGGYAIREDYDRELAKDGRLDEINFSKRNAFAKLSDVSSDTNVRNNSYGLTIIGSKFKSKKRINFSKYILVIMALSILIVFFVAITNRGSSVNLSGVGIESQLQDFAVEYTTDLFYVKNGQWVENSRKFVTNHTIGATDTPVYNAESSSVIYDNISIKDIRALKTVGEVKEVMQELKVTSIQQSLGEENTNSISSNSTINNELKDENNNEKLILSEEEKSKEEQEADNKLAGETVVKNEDGNNVNIDIEFFKIRVLFKSKVIEKGNGTEILKYQNVTYLVTKVKDEASEKGYSFFVVAKDHTIVDIPEPNVSSDDKKYIKDFMKTLYQPTGKETTDEKVILPLKKSLDIFFKTYAADREEARKLTTNSDIKLPKLQTGSDSKYGTFNTDNMVFKVFETDTPSRYEVLITIEYRTNDFGYKEVKTYKAIVVGATIEEINLIWTTEN